MLFGRGSPPGDIREPARVYEVLCGVIPLLPLLPYYLIPVIPLPFNVCGVAHEYHLAHSLGIWRNMRKNPKIFVDGHS